jgi:hypothetical protein
MADPEKAGALARGDCRNSRPAAEPGPEVLREAFLGPTLRIDPAGHPAFSVPAR